MPGKPAAGLGQTRLSLEVLRETLDALPSPILVVSTKHQVILSNLAWRQLHAGMPSPEDRPYDAVADEFCKDRDGAEQLVALVDRAFTAGQAEPIRVRTPGTLDSPEARWWQLSARFVEHGPFAIVLHEDVTALARFKREQLEALRESDARQREAMRIARAANWTWDRKTREVWQSGDLFEMLG